jgi:hypothetical protein
MGLTPVETEKPQQTRRPLAVTFIVLYEVAKGALLLYVFRGVWAAHQANVASGQTSNDPVTANPFLLLIPAAALFSLVAGFGLWNLYGWARHAFLFGGLLGLPWLKTYPTTPMATVVDYSGMQSILPRQLLIAIIAFDTLAYVTLVLYPGVAAAFGESSGDPMDLPDTDI